MQVTVYLVSRMRLFYCAKNILILCYFTVEENTITYHHAQSQHYLFSLPWCTSRVRVDALSLDKKIRGLYSAINKDEILSGVYHRPIKCIWGIFPPRIYYYRLPLYVRYKVGMLCQNVKWSCLIHRWYRRGFALPHDFFRTDYSHWNRILHKY